VTYHNYLWEPILRFGERIGQRMPLPAQNWLSETDIANLLQLTGYAVVKRGRRMLAPRRMPGISSVLNQYVAQLPIINHLGLTGYLVARTDGAPTSEPAPVPVPASAPAVARSSVTAQDQRDLFAHDAAVARHERGSAVGHLSVARAAHHLAGAVDDVVHATRHSGLPV